MSEASVPQLGALLARAMSRATWRRLMQGPLRPSWSWRVQLSAASMRAVLMESKQRGVPWLRSALVKATAPSAFLRQVRTEDVDAGGVRARWFVPTSSPDARRTIVYFHGGGFVIGSVDTHADTLSRLAVLARARVLGVEYRLAPEHRFPAAHEDALAATRWALARSEPSQVTLAGDSAGGNLAIATLCGLRDAGDALPAAAALLCPWTDPYAAGGSMESNADADFGDRELLVGWANDYVPPESEKDPRVVANTAKLEGLPPLLIQLGGAELLHDQVLAFAARARAAGVKVRLDVSPDLFHDWQLQAAVLTEGARAMEQVAEFLASDQR